MHIKRIPIDRLRTMLRETERASGPASVAVTILRRELERRNEKSGKAVRNDR